MILAMGMTWASSRILTFDMIPNPFHIGIERRAEYHNELPLRVEFINYGWTKDGS
jgi:hypothetical protein